MQEISGVSRINITSAHELVLFAIGRVFVIIIIINCVVVVFEVIIIIINCVVGFVIVLIIITYVVGVVIIIIIINCVVGFIIIIIADGRLAFIRINIRIDVAVFNGYGFHAFDAWNQCALVARVVIDSTCDGIGRGFNGCVAMMYLRALGELMCVVLFAALL